AAVAVVAIAAAVAGMEAVPRVARPLAGVAIRFGARVVDLACERMDAVRIECVIGGLYPLGMVRLCPGEPGIARAWAPACEAVNAAQVRARVWPHEHRARLGAGAVAGAWGRDSELAGIARPGAGDLLVAGTGEAAADELLLLGELDEHRGTHGATRAIGDH